MSAGRTYAYTTATTAEVAVTAKRCRLWGIRPNVVTTGTVTLRAGAAGGSDIFSLSAIGLPQAGKSFDGMILPSGFTVQTSVNTDLCLIIYEIF